MSVNNPEQPKAIDQTNLIEEDQLPEQLRVRQGKRARLLEKGIEPYPVSVPITTSIKSIREKYPNLEIDARTGEVLYSNEIDPRYHNVCVETLPNFAPMLFEDVIKRIEEEGGSVGFRNGNGPTM